MEQIKDLKPDLVICDSETCRWNIEKFTKIKTINPIELLMISLETYQKKYE